jgi:hypothetical protein
MPEPDRKQEQAVRETAYFIWEHEGRPEGWAQDHWVRAITEGFVAEHSRDDEVMDDEEKVLAGRPRCEHSCVADQGCARRVIGTRCLVSRRGLVGACRRLAGRMGAPAHADPAVVDGDVAGNQTGIGFGHVVKRVAPR